MTNGMNFKSCKTPEEKTKFYALRALNENSNILEELKKISMLLDKNSKWFELYF